MDWLKETIRLASTSALEIKPSSEMPSDRAFIHPIVQAGILSTIQYRLTYKNSADSGMKSSKLR